jgi:hypothetical protein
MKILYIPLDERPCNYKYPKLISEITSNVELLIPPKDYMGHMKKSADINAVWRWVLEHVKECGYAIISVDTLTYGNIINSRIHKRSMEECMKSLDEIKKLKTLNPHIEIHAFNLVTRVADCDFDAEDPDYWSSYGKKIWKYCYLSDKADRSEIDGSEKLELAELENSIPQVFLVDFLERRKINREVNFRCLELLKDGAIDYLTIPKDDCAEYGFAAMDQMHIANKILEYRIMDRVMIYPGADEVGSVLLSRIINKINNYKPKIYVRYSSTMGPFIIPKYEDRPLNESIKYQITSMGGIMVNSEMDADVLLAVHTPGREMLEASEQEKNRNRNRSYSNNTELLEYINYFTQKYQRPFAIADVAYANGADHEFMIHASKLGLLEKACAYGGWNTAQNTIGFVLAQASIVVCFKSQKNISYNHMASENFVLRKIIEDWLYQTLVLNEMIMEKHKFEFIDPYNVGEYDQFVKDTILERLGSKIGCELGGKFNGKKIKIDNITLPWNRAFEIDFDLKLAD